MLLHLAPSPVTRLHRAIALRYVTGPAAALSEVDALGRRSGRLPPEHQPAGAWRAQHPGSAIEPGEVLCVGHVAASGSGAIT